MIEGETKSLSEWRALIARDRRVWLTFYKEMLGSSVSSIPRFYKALSLYGSWSLFEAILSTANAKVEGDKLNYVLKVTAYKWKEAQQDEEDEAQYKKEIEGAIKISQKRNEELEKKLKKAKK